MIATNSRATGTTYYDTEPSVSDSYHNKYAHVPINIVNWQIRFRFKKMTDKEIIEQLEREIAFVEQKYNDLKDRYDILVKKLKENK